MMNVDGVVIVEAGADAGAGADAAAVATGAFDCVLVSGSGTAAEEPTPLLDNTTGGGVALAELLEPITGVAAALLVG